MIDAPDDKTIGKTISSIRRKKGLTQQEFAEKISITRALLSNYELGRNRINAVMLYKMAIALEVSSDVLLSIHLVKEDTNNVSLRFSKRVKRIKNFPEHRVKNILRTIDDMIQANESSLNAH